MIRPVQLPVREIIYHFSIEASSLPLASFIDAMTASQEILSDLNKNLFGGHVEYELRVMPPERGSFLAIITLVIDFLDTSYGKEIVKKVTGKVPVEHVRHFFERFSGNTDEAPNYEKVSDHFITEAINRVSADNQPDTLEQSEIAIECLSKAHKAILTEDIEDLKSSGITSENFSNSFRARNRLFQGCLNNSEINGLGFDRDICSQFGRESFEKLIVPESALKGSPMKDSCQKQIVQTAEISVNSPNWKRGGRKWQASWLNYNDISFAIDDPNFWNKVELGNIATTTNDILRVQWVYPTGKSKPSGNVRVIRVLEYNGKKISDSLPKEKVLAIFHGGGEVIEEEPRLF